MPSSIKGRHDVRGFVDLHSHILPGVDDGAKTLSDSVEICRGLSEIGFDTVVATPHIREAMFENTKAGLTSAYQSFTQNVAREPGLPNTALAAEYFCNDLFWRLAESGELLRYPNGKAALVELPYEKLPVRIDDHFFQLVVHGIRPVLAHPERYFFLHRDTRPIDRMLESGVLALLDVKALVGRQGKKSQRAAERMLDEGVYFGASTDAHYQADIALVEDGIERLVSLVGEEETRRLFVENPRQLLQENAG
jgi:protein-tyrosine phosphatase